MCTLSVITTATSRLRVVMNRDELLTRPRARPPERVKLGLRTALMPRDDRADGTWIGVNDAGLVAAILNVNPTSAKPARRPRSRGEVTRSVLAVSSLEQACEVVNAIEPADYACFRLLVIDRVRVAAFCSDGERLANQVDPLDDTPRFWTSSSLGDHVVAGHRGGVFERLLSGGTPAGQDAFHAEVCVDHPELGVMMSRPDARTVSTTRIERDAIRAIMHYEDHLVPSESCVCEIAHSVPPPTMVGRSA